MAACRVEVVASTVEDVRAAAKGGAHRVEFCTHLPSGGLTPGRALIEAGLEAARDSGIGFRVLVRPREGDFVYSSEERRAIVREAEALLALGVDKVVTGGLTPEGRIDGMLMSELDRAVGRDDIVFHRAVDEVQDFGSVPDQLVDAGVRTVLSSGGRVRALEGRQGIEILVRAGLEVVAGSGVQPDQAGMLIPLGVEALHASCRRPAAGWGGGKLFDPARTEVDPAMVESLVKAVRGA